LLITSAAFELPGLVNPKFGDGQKDLFLISIGFEVQEEALLKYILPGSNKGRISIGFHGHPME